MLWMIFRISVLAYLGFVLIFFGLQRKIIFPATREMDRDPSVYQWAYEEVILEVDRKSTYGWYVPLEKARGVVLFSHGNGGNLSGRLESIGLLRELGFSVLAYDYGGYGNSTGKASEKRCYADALAMWHWLIEEKGVSPDQIVLFGRSLGGAVTIDLATKVQPAAVVAESTFTSMVDIGKEKFRKLPVSLFLRHRFMNKEKVDKIGAPLLIVHSPDDTLIPFHHGRKLFDLAKDPKYFMIIHGDHNEGFVQSIKTYKSGWLKFMALVLPLPE